MRIQLDRIAIAHAGESPLLRNVSATLEPGWTALVGANGAGKSSLLRLLAGHLAAHEGVVHGLKGCRLAAVWQHAERADGAVRALAADESKQGWKLKATFGLDPADPEARWSALSPGQRKRWQVAAALGRYPQVLLLDEPDSHLDAEARAALVTALGQFKGIGVVVAHDRAFLRQLAQRTLLLHDGTATFRASAADVAMDEHARGVESALQARGEARRRADQLAARAQAADERRRSAERSRSARVRGRGRADADARSIGARNLADWAAGRAARSAGQAAERTRRALARVEALPDVPHHSNASFVLDGQPARTDPVLACSGAQVRAGSRVILRDVHLSLQATVRVHVRGPNGAGKTTLLSWMRGQLRLPSERVLHMPQDLTREEERALRKALDARGGVERAHALHIVAALGSSPPAVLGTDALSPGLARKLWLGLSLTAGAHVLLLDEPTNHLDLPAILALQAALERWPAALVLVTHDEDFAAACTSETWTVAGGTVRQGRWP